MPDAIRLISSNFLTHPDSTVRQGNFNVDLVKLANGNDTMATPGGTDRTRSSIAGSSNDLPYCSRDGWGSEPMARRLLSLPLLTSLEMDANFVIPTFSDHEVFDFLSFCWVT